MAERGSPQCGTDAMSGSMPELVPHTNVWIEVGGEVALSRWRVELLQAIDRAGSINAAAEAMNIQYRLAWQRLHEMEERLGITLVHTATGGKGGGGTTLTPAAYSLIERFLAISQAVDAFTAEQCRLHLPGLPEAVTPPQT